MPRRNIEKNEMEFPVDFGFSRKEDLTSVGAESRQPASQELWRE